MFLRPYQPADAEAIAQLYRDAVLVTGAEAYSAEQVAAWAAFPEDLADFRVSLQQGLTLVGWDDATLTAFGQLHPADHIAFLYTAPAYARCGYATAIYQQLEEEAQRQGVAVLRTEASRISKFFFLKQGFEVKEVETVVRHGVELDRFKMHKDIVALHQNPLLI